LGLVVSRSADDVSARADRKEGAKVVVPPKARAVVAERPTPLGRAPPRFVNPMGEDPHVAKGGPLIALGHGLPHADRVLGAPKHVRVPRPIRLGGLVTIALPGVERAVVFDGNGEGAPAWL
jgi:hypothetical protein